MSSAYEKKCETCGKQFNMTPIQKDGKEKWEPRNLDGTYHTHPKPQGGEPAIPEGWAIRVSKTIANSIYEVEYLVKEKDKVALEMRDAGLMLDAIEALKKGVPGDSPKRSGTFDASA